MTNPLDGLPAPTNEPETPPDPAPAAGKTGGTDGDDGKKRTADNVHGELTRKLGKQDETIAALQQQVQSLVSTPAPIVTPQPTTLEEMSSTQLTAVRNDLPEDDPRRAQMDSYIAERQLDERVDTKVNAASVQREQKRLRTEANQLAVDRWPELSKAGSFRMAVNDQLESTGTASPNAVLAAANEVALARGMTPANVTGQTRGNGNIGVSPGHTNAPIETTPATTLPEEKLNSVAQGLRNAMPSGTFSKTNLDNVRANAQTLAKQR